MKYMWRNPYHFYPDSPYERAVNLIKIAGGLGPVCMFDTSGNIRCPSMVDAFPDISNFFQSAIEESTQTYAEVMESKLTSILEYAEANEKRIYFWYSGGIDSASIACGLIKMTSDKPQWANLISVMANGESRREYPSQFDLLVSTFAIKDSSDFSQWFDEGVINVDGAYGDTLFGSSVLTSLYGDQANKVSNMKVEKTLDVLARILGGKMAERVYNQTLPLIEGRAKSVYDFFWLQGLHMNYQDLNLIPLIRIADVTTRRPETLRRRVDENLVGRVFGTPEFIRFSLSYGATRTDYSRPRECSLKYTYDETGDLDYYRYKQKEFSQGKIYQKSPVGAIREDMTFEYTTTYRL